MKVKAKLILRYIFMAVSVAVMVLIFVFSSQNGDESGELSSGIAEFITGVFDALKMPFMSDFVLTYIRKCAHVTIYAVLGISVSICVFTYPIKDKWLYILIPIVICFLYACSDEFHQIFISGRDGKFTDVLIDSIGFIFTTLISNLIYFLIKRRNGKTALSEKTPVCKSESCAVCADSTDTTESPDSAEPSN